MQQSESLPSYDQPTQTTSYASVNPRPLAPLESLPVCSELPALPSAPRESPFKGYLLTSHIVPAAYPRHPCNLAPAIPRIESVEARKERVERLRQELISGRLQDQEGIKRGHVQENVLFNVFNRYLLHDHSEEKGNRIPLSLLVLHANGFPKEVSLRAF
jgi:hypothetical protein